MGDESKEIPIVIIVFAFIFCWPIGIFLLYLKYIKGFKIEKKSKISTFQRKQKNNQTFAIVFLMATLIFVSVTLPDPEEDFAVRIGDSVLFIALFGIPSYLFFKRAKKQKDIIEKTIEYNDLITIRNITSIDELSKKLNVSREEVLKFVSQMIRDKQIDAYIKKESEIILKGNNFINNKIFSLKCTNCGAENKFIEGEENICEYCGSVLNK